MINDKILNLGIDIGSTTVKVVVTNNQSKKVFSQYKRHYSEIKLTLLKIMKQACEELGNIKMTVVITGSGGFNYASILNCEFVQEVVGTSKAVEVLEPKTDVAIELGGEDAKIIYFTNGIDQRMNGVCAGGTGSFIDQMASLLQTDAEGINELAKNYKVIYPIASRCGVFAKTDIQPLINEGALKEDLAASIFQAVVNQTIGGLACGKPIKGKIAFLGGPLHFMSELRKRFVETLNLTEETTIIPTNNHLFAAFGAAISVKNYENVIKLGDFITNIENLEDIENEVTRLNPLFKTEEEYLEFKKRHEKNKVKRLNLDTYKGNAFLGIDAGSTTTKLALISNEGELLHSCYSSNEGNPLVVVIKMIKELYEILHKEVKISNSCVTGYGEKLIKEALLIDLGYIETVAHYKAAKFFKPDVDFILDIGGQDMKCIRIDNDAIDDVLLNEACSSGCGSFIETFAKSLNHKIEDFSQIALFGEKPIDLGTRCTVFMNSRVKQAQKEGAMVSDISAGLAYSVVKNALFKVIKIANPKAMGKNIVVQGGTFYNDAVLRTFEMVSEKEAVRPDISGIMGAFGASLIAKEKFENGYVTTLIDGEKIDALKISATHSRCKLCTNNCLLTINTFNNARRFITGNRCEKGLGKVETTKEVPNLYEYKKKRVFNYESLSEVVATKGVIGIPRVLNMYENYPFWHIFLTTLGFSVKLSPFSSKELYEKGQESIPSESECYPAKLVHGHIVSLIEMGVNRIFYPSIAYERNDEAKGDETYNCPIVTSYSENIKNNSEDIKEKNIDFINPFLSFKNKKALVSRLYETFKSFDINEKEINIAVEKGFAEWDCYKNDVRLKAAEALKYIEEKNIMGVVLCGRPYHADPEINHGIPELITSYNVAVLSEDSVAHLGSVKRPLNVRDQWAYHSRLYDGADFVKTKSNLEYIQLNSFGCGLDAVTSDEVKDILHSGGKMYTALKIDEINNLGAARIRIRSLIAAVEERKRNKEIKNIDLEIKKVVFTEEMRKDYTILSPQMAPIHFDLLIPALNSCGYNIKLLPEMDKEAIDIGLKYVNNDACYPAIIVVGQIMKAIQSGEYDVNKLAVFMSQTGGGCRASNYVGFIRRAFENAGIGNIPVISVNAGGLENNPGWKLGIKGVNKIVQSLVYGDLLMKVLLATRPYEKEVGSANKLYTKWSEKLKIDLATARDFSKNIENIVKEFDSLPLLEVIKPKVGVVGEILVKFHPTANNDIISVLENEGAEVVVPDLLSFALYSGYNGVLKNKLFGEPFKSSLNGQGFVGVVELYRHTMKRALKRSKRFTEPLDVNHLANLTEGIVSLGNQTGEGWLLTAEMIELIHSGVNNVICAQPFACLPNHVVGKGVIKEIKSRYPKGNIVAIDYDPGASEVNQLNRIKLAMATAEKNLQEEIDIYGRKGIPNNYHDKLNNKAPISNEV